MVLVAFMIPDSIGIIVVAEVALEICCPWSFHLAYFISDVVVPGIFIFMSLDSIGIVAVT